MTLRNSIPHPKNDLQAKIRLLPDEKSHGPNIQKHRFLKQD